MSKPKSPTGTLKPVNPSAPKQSKRPLLNYNENKAPSVVNWSNT